jgi:HK97 family phage major capsid protein
MMEAIDGIAKGFEEFKKVNDQKIAEEAKGNQARAKELQDTLDKIGNEITAYQKNKEVLDRKLATQQERLEILEALSERPRATVQDKLRSEHKDLFMRWMRSGGNDRTAEEEYRNLVKKSMEFKDVLIGTDASGGFALPEEISRTIDKLLLKQSDIYANVKVVQVGSQDYKELVSVNDATGGWSAETGTRNATLSPTLRNRVPTWGELYALPRTSSWSLEDLFFNVENWLVDNITETHAILLSTAIYNGNGSDKPTGMFNTAPSATDDYNSPERNHAAIEYIPITAHSSPFATAGVGADDIIALVYQLRAGYRGNAKFAMNSVTQGHVRKLKDSNGQYLWQPSLQAGQPDRLLGYSIFTWEDLGNPTTGNAYPIVFGDFNKAYTVATRAGVSILRDPYSTKGYVAFYVARRVGGCVTNNNAVKALKVALS